MVPIPRSVNERSTCSRGGPDASARPGSAEAQRASAASSSSRPAGPRIDTATVSAAGTSSRASAAARSGSARSAFVMATTPWSTPSWRSTAACSRVWGITPSSAATQSRNRSMPEAPATIVRTKRSWPGTSTTDSRRPPGSSSGA